MGKILCIIPSLILCTFNNSKTKNAVRQESVGIYVGSGQFDRFCSKISGLAGLPMMRLAALLVVLLHESCLVFYLPVMREVGSCCIFRCTG